MAPRFGIDFTSDIGARLETWAEQFVSETSWRRYQRACAFVMDETAKHVAMSMRAAAPTAMEHPTPWTIRGFQYRRSLGKGRSIHDGVASEFFIADDQSIVLKYLLGYTQNVRMPGDVGLAQDRIYLPAWRNLRIAQGILPNKHGNLPGGVMARLNREAEGDRSEWSKKKKTRSAGVFKKEVMINGSPALAYISRPARRVTNEPAYIPHRDGGSRVHVVRKVVNVDRPRVLMWSIPKATYDPSLQRAWDTSVNEALDMIPERMANELAEGLRHMAAGGRA